MALISGNDFLPSQDPWWSDTCPVHPRPTAECLSTQSDVNKYQTNRWMTEWMSEKMRFPREILWRRERRSQANLGKLQHVSVVRSRGRGRAGWKHEGPERGSLGGGRQGEEGRHDEHWKLQVQRQWKWGRARMGGKCSFQEYGYEANEIGGWGVALYYGRRGASQAAVTTGKRSGKSKAPGV